MWSYEKKLQYPVNIKNPNPKLAQMIISQYGGAYINCYIKNHFFSALSPSNCRMTLFMISGY